MNSNAPTARIADMQSRGLENAVAFGRVATNVFERLARQNYAVMGDVVDYTLEQMRIPTRHADPRAALEAQAAGTRDLAVKARVRADEYVAIAGEVRDLVGSAVRVGTSNATAGTATATATAAATAKGRATAPASNATRDTGSADDTQPAPVPGAADRAARAATAPSANEDTDEGTGGTPIILPEDSPKSAVRKTAVAASTPKPSDPKVVVAGKGTTKRDAAKKGAAKESAAKPRAAAKRSAAKKSARGTKA